MPLGEMMGGGGKTCPQCNNALAVEAVFCIQCGYNLQTGQGSQSLPAGGAPQVAEPVTYNPGMRKVQKTNQLLALGIMVIVGVVLPHIAFSPFKIYFQNFDLGGGLPTTSPTALTAMCKSVATSSRLFAACRPS